MAYFSRHFSDTKVDLLGLLSSPEPKAQVRFSDQNLSVVRRRRWRWRKLFTISYFSPEPLGRFQPNLAQSILGLRGFKFVQMKSPVLFQGETTSFEKEQSIANIYSYIFKTLRTLHFYFF